MKRTAVILLQLFIAIHGVNGQFNYAANAVPDSLRHKSEAIIRYSSTSYERTSLNKFKTNVHLVITIMNERGKHASELLLYYDRNSKITKIQGSIYNKQGVRLKDLKKNDIRDYAVNASYTLFSDSRVKHFRPAVSDYPYTIEYKYSIENKGIVGLATWVPQKGFNISVEKAELKFTTPQEYDIKSRELNHQFSKDVRNSNNKKTYTWSVSHLKAIDYEVKAPGYLDFMPSVLLSPNDIEYEGTTGDFSSWSSYGRWVHSLIASRDALSDETIKRIQELTDSLPDNRAKAMAVYRYMQDRTRYVNIALGIGGFQPMEADVVDKKGYGDCKALSNYTKALLQAAGIESYYAEIGTGRYHEIKFPDFASTNQTNHVMLCVPLEGDTVWLECTNQKIPFGYIGLSSQNRYALLVKPEGGVLAKTPSYDAGQNTRISKIECTIHESGEANYTSLTTYHNNLYSQVFELMNYSAGKQKDELLKYLSGIRTVRIADFYLKDNSGTDFNAELFINGTIGNYPVKAGARLVFEPLFLHPAGVTDFVSLNRKLPVYEPLEYTCIDTFQVKIPRNYEVEYLMENQEFTNNFGHYYLEARYTGDIITVFRKMTVFKGLFNHAMFEEINDFIKTVSGNERKKIILKEVG